MTETIEIDREAAEVALRELKSLVRETGDATGTDDYMTPLARARQRVDRRADRIPDDDRQTRFGKGKRVGLDEAVEIIEDVGEQTGAETTTVDPLQDDVFRARDELQSALD